MDRVHSSAQEGSCLEGVKSIIESGQQRPANKSLKAGKRRSLLSRFIASPKNRSSGGKDAFPLSSKAALPNARRRMRRSGSVGSLSDGTCTTATVGERSSSSFSASALDPSSSSPCSTGSFSSSSQGFSQHIKLCPSYSSFASLMTCPSVDAEGRFRLSSKLKTPPLEVEFVSSGDEEAKEGDASPESESVPESETDPAPLEGASSASSSAVSSAEKPIEQEDTTSPEQQRIAAQHYDIARKFAEEESLDCSLDEVNEGLKVLSLEKEPVCAALSATCPTYWNLLQLKAEVLCRMGQHKESLSMYQQVLENTLAPMNEGGGGTARARRSEGNDSRGSVESLCTPADVANLLYACGRLSVHLGLVDRAVEYYLQELEITQAVVDDPSCSTEVSRIYHEVARLHRQGLGDSRQALFYYREALRIDVELWKREQSVSSSCPRCRKRPSSPRSPGGVAGLCPVHAARVKEAALQVEETKRCMGRIHFELGNLERAVQLSIRRL